MFFCCGSPRIQGIENEAPSNASHDETHVDEGDARRRRKDLGAEASTRTSTSPDYTPVTPFRNNKWGSITDQSESARMGRPPAGKRIPSNKALAHSVDGPETPDDHARSPAMKGSPIGTSAASMGSDVGPPGFLRAHHRTQIPAIADADGSTESFLPGQAGDTAFSGDELYTMGFRVYSADSVESSTSSSLAQAVAFVVLEAGRLRAEQSSSGSRRILIENGSMHGRRGTGRNRLIPEYANRYCLDYFKMDSSASYIGVIKKLLKRDPLLTFALQKAVRHLKAGDSTAVTHVTPDPSGQTSALYGLRLTPCLWKGRDGRLQPSLMMEHNVAYNPAEVMPRLMRDYAVLSHVPAILTLIDFEGKVLYQNASSLEYMGDLLSAKYDHQLSDGLLHVLFSFDQGSLEDMLENVLGGSEWQGVVQVPYSLMRYLGVQQYADTIIDFARADDQSSSKAYEEIEPEDEEEEFQIGETRAAARKRQSVAFFLKQQSNQSSVSDLGDHTKRNGSRILEAQLSGAEAPAPSPLSQQGARMSLAGEELAPQNSSTGRTAMAVSMSGGADLALGAPGLSQRKFMSLIDNQPKVSKQAGQMLSREPTNAALTIAEESVRNMSPSGRQEEEDDYDDFDVDEDEDEEFECYHEIHAIPLLDPVLDKQVVMLVQTDVTPRVELENKLADLTDAQLSMLEQLFPRHIIEYMLARLPTKVGKNIKGLANNHEKVMVLFCDVVGFTSMSKEVEPSAVMNFLNELYECFDTLCDDYNMYKLDIVGDCYIVVAGLIKEDQDGFVCVEDLDEDQVALNAIRIMQFGKAMLRHSKPILMPHDKSPVKIRIGIHTGPLVSGLVGSKMPKFTLFGDTMNTASRMESTCKPGCIQVSDAFKNLVPHEDWEATGGVQVKGKGLMETFIYTPTKKHELLDLDPQSLKTTKRLDKSFTSGNSKSLTNRSTSAHRQGRGSESGNNKNHESGNNALMTILTNLRGGGDDDGEDQAGHSGEGPSQARSRPKSGHRRKSVAVYKHSRENIFGSGGEEADAEGQHRPGPSEQMVSGMPPSPDVRRSGGKHQNLLSMLPGQSSFKNQEGGLPRTKSRGSKPTVTYTNLSNVASLRTTPISGLGLEGIYDNTSSKGGGDARSSKDARSSAARSSMGRSGASTSSFAGGASSLPSEGRSMGSMGKISERRREEDLQTISTELDEDGNEVLLLAG